MLVLLALFAAGCKPDNMSTQPKYAPYQPSDFFPDGASARPVPPGTVPREPAVVGVAYGLSAGAPLESAQAVPFPVTRAVLGRGQERFDVYCAVCHGRLGNGEGMVVQRGFVKPPSFHIDRLRQAPDAHFYNVMTNGYGAMFSYAERVPPDDRWAIVAYIRALQLAPDAAAAAAAATLSDADRKTLYGTGQGVHQP